MRIRSFCSPQAIRKCTFDREFTFHAHFKSLYTSRELLEKAAEQPGVNIVLALAPQNHITGYAVLAYPDSGERWAEYKFSDFRSFSDPYDNLLWQNIFPVYPGYD